MRRWSVRFGCTKCCKAPGKRTSSPSFGAMVTPLGRPYTSASGTGLRSSSFPARSFGSCCGLGVHVEQTCPWTREMMVRREPPDASDRGGPAARDGELRGCSSCERTQRPLGHIEHARRQPAGPKDGPPDESRAQSETRADCSPAPRIRRNRRTVAYISLTLAGCSGQTTDELKLDEMDGSTGQVQSDGSILDASQFPEDAGRDGDVDPVADAAEMDANTDVISDASCGSSNPQAARLS